MRGLIFPIGPEYEFELGGSMEEKINKKMKIGESLVVASRLQQLQRYIVIKKKEEQDHLLLE